MKLASKELLKTALKIAKIESDEREAYDAIAESVKEEIDAEVLADVIREAKEVYDEAKKAADDQRVIK